MCSAVRRACYYNLRTRCTLNMPLANVKWKSKGKYLKNTWIIIAIPAQALFLEDVLYTLGQYFSCFGHRSKNEKLGTRTRSQSFLPIFCQQVNYFGDIRDTLKIFIQFHTLLASALVSDAISLITLSDCTIKTYFTLFDLKQTLAHKQSFSPC